MSRGPSLRLLLAQALHKRATVRTWLPLRTTREHEPATSVHSCSTCGTGSKLACSLSASTASPAELRLVAMAAAAPAWTGAPKQSSGQGRGWAVMAAPAGCLRQSSSSPSRGTGSLARVVLLVHSGHEISDGRGCSSRRQSERCVLPLANLGTACADAVASCFCDSAGSGTLDCRVPHDESQAWATSS
jgi:hypothetical protein